MKINEKILCMFASTPPFDYEGYLNKRGEVNKAFQRRYFVLKGNLLFYFEKKTQEPLGVIIVEGCTIELCEESEQYCFQMVFNGNRTYVLSADNQEVMEAWMKVLTCAGYEYKKLMLAELQRQLEEIEGTKKQRLGQVEPSKVPLKPPRTRTNPFNRPAPPPPPGLISLEPSSSSSLSLSQQQQQPQANGTSCSAGVSKTNNAKTVLSTIELFKKMHDHFHKDVMKDIDLYRATKELAEKPLIDI